MALHGNITEFHEESDKWKVYKEWFVQYFIANDIDNIYHCYRRTNIFAVEKLTSSGVARGQVVRSIKRKVETPFVLGANS